jgi:hypothetical protein
MSSGGSLVSITEVWTSLIWSVWSYGIKNYSVKVIFSGMIFIINIYWLVQNLIGGTDTQRVEGNLIKPTFIQACKITSLSVRLPVYLSVP